MYGYGILISLLYYTVSDVSDVHVCCIFVKAEESNRDKLFFIMSSCSCLMCMHVHVPWKERSYK